MSEPIILEDKRPKADPKKIGISYSGGGPLFLIEVGIAKAFVERNIYPDVIAGVSAGAIAGTAHALDTKTGRGLDMAQEVAGLISPHTLGLGKLQIAERAVVQNFHLKSLGDNYGIAPLVQQALRKHFQLNEVRVSYFQPPDRPKLMIAATNRLNGESLWFTGSVLIEDVLVASSAIPAVFPWYDLSVGSKPYVLVDGGVVTNQPLSKLALDGCGTIFACAVGWTGGTAPPPTNLVQNLEWSFYMAIHQTTKLEEALVQSKLPAGCKVHHIHPEVNFPMSGYNFTPALIEQVIEDSRAKTVDWLIKLGF